MSNEEKLFWEIFNCNGEESLHKLVSENNLLKDRNNWLPYGSDDPNNKNNFAEFENQQAHPIPALVEKVTNSIDSILLKKCLQNKIDPKSKDAPRSMAEAVEKYLGIKNGDFSEVSQEDRRNISLDIQVIT